MEHGKGGNNGQCLHCVKGIITMRKKGVFGHALINPRGKGWPVLVQGKDIDKYFSNK